jgi:hypothetical protein
MRLPEHYLHDAPTGQWECKEEEDDPYRRDHEEQRPPSHDEEQREAENAEWAFPAYGGAFCLLLTSGLRFLAKQFNRILSQLLPLSFRSILDDFTELARELFHTGIARAGAAIRSGRRVGLMHSLRHGSMFSHGCWAVNHPPGWSLYFGALCRRR